VTATLAPIAGARPLFPEEDIPGILSEIGEVLRSGRLILGPRTRALETESARRIGTAHAIAVSSCSAALEITMRYYGVEGREVLVPTNTFVATAHAALNAGARVRFVDIDPRDFCLDVDQAIAQLGSQTAAVVVVHIAGFIPHGYQRLRDACTARKIPIVEDCAHAHGATLGGKVAGALGDAGCFSFYPTKILTSGVGGLITTNDTGLADHARSLRHHGQGSSLEEISNFGSDWLMDEVRAVLALAQTRRLDDFLARRRATAMEYDRLLAGERRLVRAQAADGCAPAFYKYPVLLPEGIDREGISKRLLEEDKIETGAVYNPPTHRMPVFQGHPRILPGALPKADEYMPRQICLPMHAAVSAADAARSVRALLRLLDDPPPR